MDLRSIKAAETAFLHLKDVNDEPLFVPGADGLPDKAKAVGITLYGPGSKPYVKANAARHARTMEKVRKKGTLKQSAAELAAENAEFLTAITAQFHHIERTDGDGKPLEGEALYRATYEDAEIGFIAAQAHEFAGDWANFSKASAKASPSS